MAAKSASPAALQILEELGVADLPRDWDIVRVESLLCDDCGIAVGVMYPGDYDTAGIPLIRAGDLSGSRINPKPEFRITTDKHHEYRRTELAGGELLISLVGDVGRCALVPPQMAGWNVARAIAVLRFSSPPDAAFVRACLMSSPLQHLMRAWSTTTVQATLNLKEIRQIPLPWPPKNQRDAIAHILGTLNDKIELNRHMNETLEAMARALFKSWFEDFLPVRANMEARNRKARTQTGDPVRAKAEGRDHGLPKPLADLFPDAFEDSELGEIPKGWDVCTIGDLSKLNPESWSRETRPAVIEYVDLSNTKWGRIEAVTRFDADDAPSRAQRVLRPRDTIVGTVRPGNGSYALILVDGLTGSTGFAVLRPRSDKYAEFVYLAATMADNIETLAHLADGGAYPAVRPEAVAATKIARPKDNVFVAFSHAAGSMLLKIADNEGESCTLAALRDALLPKLISGELRMKDAERFANADYHLAHLRIRTD